MSQKIVKHTAVTVIPPRKNKPLTVKLDKAIHVYAKVKGVRDNMVDVATVITAAVAAYRMDNEELFRWLERNRYRWDSSRAQWRDLRREF
jgi:hypothetical protein